MRKQMMALGVCVATLAFGGVGLAAEVSSPEMAKPAASGPKWIDFDPKTYEGPVGTVVLSGKGAAELTLQKIEDGKPGDLLVVKDKSATMKLPVGDYQIIAYSLKATLNDKEWSIIGIFPDPAKRIPLGVKLAKIAKPKLGASLSASIKVTQKDAKTVALDLTVLGQSGEKCIIEQDGAQSDPPGFEVLSDSGAVVMSGKFAYG